MRFQFRHDFAVGLPFAGRDRQTRVQLWRSRLFELLGLTALISIVVVAATWISHPRLRIIAASEDATRSLVNFWPIEQNEQEIFRWSQASAGLRLFGFEQRGPVLIHARLTTVREAGSAPARLTISNGQSEVSFTIAPNVWRDYWAALPVPARGDEAPLLSFQSSKAAFKDDPRNLGFVLGRIEAEQYPIGLTQHLPDFRRVLFFVLAGLLIYLAIRRAGGGASASLLIMVALTLGLGAGIALAPGTIAYWLPNLWFSLLVGVLALAAPSFVRWLRAGFIVSRRTAVLVGMFLLAGAQILLPLEQRWSSVAGWALLLGGGTLLSGSLPAPRRDAADQVRGHTVALVLFACTVLALVLRVVALDQLPLGMWRDEARHGLLALRILRDPTFRPVYVPVLADIPALLFYLAAIPIAAFGPHPWTVRLVPALAGALTPLTLYWAARPLFGVRVALLTAALLAVSVWHIALSRLAFAATLGPLLTTLALGLIWRALQDGPPRRRYIQAGLAGACSGLALYAYHPSRLTPLVVALMVVLVLGLDWRAWRAAAPRLFVVIAAMLLVLGPLIQYAVGNSDAFSNRINQTFIFSEGGSDGHAPAWLFEQNVRLIVGMWNEHGDTNGRHNLSGAPMLDPITGLAFVAGVGLVLVRLRDRRILMALLWLGVMLIPGLLSGQAPHAVRTVEAIPPTLLSAGLGGVALFDWASRNLLAPGKVRLGWAVRLVLIGCLLAVNSWRYFVAWPATLPAYQEYDVANTHIGAVAQQLASAPELVPGHYHVLIYTTSDDNDVLNYLMSGFSIQTTKADHLLLPAGEQPLLIMRGNRPTADQAYHILGDSATLIGTGPRSPVSGQPEFVIYGRGAPEQAVTSKLAGWLSAK
jgi:4-amino-4-deoxy-L-arabinose transferase-like glycosyltransferase